MGGLRKRYSRQALTNFTETLEAFLTGVSYKFFCWLRENEEIFAQHKAELYQIHLIRYKKCSIFNHYQIFLDLPISLSPLLPYFPYSPSNYTDATGFDIRGDLGINSGITSSNSGIEVNIFYFFPKVQLDQLPGINAIVRLYFNSQVVTKSFCLFLAIIGQLV